MSVHGQINMTPYSCRSVAVLPFPPSMDAHWCDFIPKSECLSAPLNLNISAPWTSSVSLLPLIVKFLNPLTRTLIGWRPRRRAAIGCRRRHSPVCPAPPSSRRQTHAVTLVHGIKTSVGAVTQNIWANPDEKYVLIKQQTTNHNVDT